MMELGISHGLDQERIKEMMEYGYGPGSMLMSQQLFQEENDNSNNNNKINNANME